MEIIFVRHGETTWNIEGRLQGQTNESKLTQRGIKQAEELAETLEDLNYDIIISSPYERTLETAKIINKNKKKEIIIDDLLKERGYGLLEGEYAKNGKYNIEQMWDFKDIYKDYEIEPIDIFFERVYKFLDNIIKEKKHQKVLVVSHSGVSIAMNTYFNGMPQNNNLLSLGIKNCEVIIFNDNKI